MHNALKTTLAAGRMAVGTWAVMPCATASEVMAAAGFDFVIIDMEHGPHGFEGAEQMIRAVEAAGATPLVRVPGVDESAILRALDTGAHGIVVPQIQSVEQAERAIAYAFYPPKGERGHSPFTRAGGFTHRGAAERISGLNARTFVCLLIEGAAGIAALPDILSRHSADVDVIYIGVYDLAQSMGHPGDVNAPAVQAKVAEIIAAAADAGVCLGILANTVEDVARYGAMGVRFIAFQNDTGLLFEACRRVTDARDAAR